MNPLGQIVAQSPSMVHAIRLCHLYARALVPVILVGPTGTGKSLLASLIHSLSERPGRFVEVSAGELTRDLADDDLFGHGRGAFTGASNSRSGLIASAADGTLLLDDFHLLERRGQAALLRAMEQKAFRPLGIDRDARAQCRVLIGLGVDPDELVKTGGMLPDLRWRLGECIVYLLPLSARREEIEPLANRFLESCPGDTGVSGPSAFAPEVIPVLCAAAWPGNVRELRGVVQASFLQAQGADRIELRHLPARMTAGSVRQPSEGVCSLPGTAELAQEPGLGIVDNVPRVRSGDNADDEIPSLAAVRRRAEVRAILDAVQREGGNRERAAAVLRISPATLYRKLNGHLRAGAGDGTRAIGVAPASAVLSDG